MRKVVITGATSFLGSKLVKKMVEEKYFVYAVVRPNSKNITNIDLSANVQIIQCDLDNIIMLPDMIDEKCDCFYHIAWNGTRVPERDDHTLQNKNYEAAINSYLAAKKLGCKTYISTGSQAEYGKCIGVITEDYETKPITEYGKSKFEAFKQIKKMALNDGLKFGWIRIFSAYGPGDYSQSLVSLCIDKMKKNEPVYLTTCEQNWNYIYVDDVVNILYEMLVNDNYFSEVFNVCSDDSRKLKDFVLEIKAIIDSTSILYFGGKDYNSSEGVVSFFPSNEKIKKILNYKTFFTFDYGIRKILEK